MTWLDQLRPASFRGVPFHVDTIDHSAGDNVVMREYPFQDVPTVFRMGEAAEEIKLSAYVIGDDYTEQRDALRQVLTGDGILVHPTAGRLRVFVGGKYSIKEAPTAEGGIARFDLMFIRAESRRYPAGVPSSRADAVAKATAARVAARDQFAAAWSIANKPGWVADGAVGRLRNVLTSAWPVLSATARDLGEFNSTLIGGFQSLRDGLDTLVAAPRQLADQVATLFELPADLSNATARAFQQSFQWVFTVSERVRSTSMEQVFLPAPGAGLVMFGTGSSVASQTQSADRIELERLQAAGDALFESLATASWVQATAAVDLSSYDEALTMRSTVHAQFVRLMERASSAVAASTGVPASSYHEALMSLHTAALADLQARSRDLVRLTTFTPEAWMPVWAISFRLFGTAEFADEILAMNPHITHPLLVPPGRALRVARH